MGHELVLRQQERPEVLGGSQMSEALPAQPLGPAHTALMTQPEMQICCAHQGPLSASGKAL